MPTHMKAKCKKAGKKVIKMPEGVLPITKSTDCLPKSKDNPTIDKSLEDFCDELMNGEWHSHCSRPVQRDMFGFYVICRWFAKEKSWVLLYVGRGIVRDKLEMHFSGRQIRSPIGSYLSSFPKASRNLLWMKWIKDPFYPYEGPSLEDVITVLAIKYNNGETPAFNMDLEVEEDLPKDFTILPGWTKSTRSKK